MSLLFLDGFDHYDNIRFKWSVSSGFDNPTFALGRFGGQALKKQSQNSAGSIQKTLTSKQHTLIVGLALYISNTGFPQDDLLTFRDSVGTVILTLTMIRDSETTEGHLEVSKPGTALNPTVDNFPTWSIKQWHYIEVMYNPNKTGGTVDIRLDGTQVYLAQGRTTEKADNDVQSVQIMGTGTNSPAYLIDDLYILNADGTSNNTFLGQIRISQASINPSAAPIIKQSLGDSATLSTVLINTSTFLSMGVLNSFDDYEMAPPCVYLKRTLIAPIHGVQVVTTTAKDNSGIIKYQQVVNSTINGPDITPGTFNGQVTTDGFFCETQTFDEDPTDTGSPWSVAKIADMRIGFRLTAREGGA